MIELRRLAWAGLEVQAGGETAVIDLVEDFSFHHGDLPPKGEVPPSPPPGTVALGLLTHLHSDHADSSALARALRDDGVVLRPHKATGGPAETCTGRAVAAELLGAREVIPIHYGPLHMAANYVQADDPAGSLCTAAHNLGVAARVLRPGERFQIEPT